MVFGHLNAKLEHILPTHTDPSTVDDKRAPADDGDRQLRVATNHHLYIANSGIRHWPKNRATSYGTG